MGKYIKYLYVSLLLPSMLSSCNDADFLKEKPTTFYTVDNAFQTTAQVDQTLITLYSEFRNLQTNPENNSGVALLKGYATDCLDEAENRKNQSMANYNNFTTTNGNLKSLFNTFYGFISKANLTIYAANLPQIVWDKPDDKAYVIAQARFFRAYAYGVIADYWGGMPLVTEIVTAPKLDFKRETRATVYQYCIDELLAIENQLPPTTKSSGRVVRGAAQHYLAQMYLALGCTLHFEGKAADAKTAFDNCVTQANKLIDGGQYDIMTARFGTRKNDAEISLPIYPNGILTPEKPPVYTIKIPTNHIWDLYQEGNIDFNTGNKESIFTVQVDYGAFKLEDKLCKLMYPRMFGISAGAVPAHFKGSLEDLGGRGVVMRIPMMYWREEIWKDKFANDLRNSEVMIRRKLYANVPTSSYYCKPVPWEVIYSTSLGKSHIFPISAKNTTDKFVGLEDGQDRSNLFRDDYVFRLAETVLIRAEAKQRLGDKPGAAADINILRDRAECDYRVTAADMDDNFEMLLDERCRELMYEENRWNTLLRMGGTVAVDRQKKYNMWADNINTMNKKYNLWPIPQSAIDANTGLKMEQNDGWK